MKSAKLFILFLCFVQEASAQYDYGFGNTSELIKSKAVRSLSIYYFKSQSDSVLTNLNTYDRSGRRLSAKMFSGEDGAVSNCDTFIYERNDLLIKQINWVGGVKRYESVSTYREDGQLLSVVSRGDSIPYDSINIRLDSTRLKKIIRSEGLRDTVNIEHFFNRKGQRVKIIAHSTQGTSIHKSKFNALGKVTKGSTVQSDLQSQSEARYLPNGHTVVNSSMIANGRKSTYRTILSFNANGLGYQLITYMNHKPHSVQRILYTYY